MTAPVTNTETAIVIDILRKNAVRLRQIVEAHKQVAYDAHAKLYKAEAEIDKLKDLLIIRDGGGHDTDCKANYNRQCNCGHDSVEEYFNEEAK